MSLDFVGVESFLRKSNGLFVVELAWIDALALR